MNMYRFAEELKNKVMEGVHEEMEAFKKVFLEEMEALKEPKTTKKTTTTAKKE